MVKDSRLPLDVTPHTLRFRQFDPDICARIRNKRFTKGVMGAICYVNNRGGRTQSVIFDRDKFTITQARKWLKKHDFISTQKRINPSNSSGKDNNSLIWPLVIIGGVVGLSILASRAKR